jgi:uncharacterized protein YneF (UPF0154 family)
MSLENIIKRMVKTGIETIKQRVDEIPDEERNKSAKDFFTLGYNIVAKQLELEKIEENVDIKEEIYNLLVSSLETSEVKLDQELKDMLKTFVVSGDVEELKKSGKLNEETLRKVVELFGKKIKQNKASEASEASEASSNTSTSSEVDSTEASSNLVNSNETSSSFAGVDLKQTILTKISSFFDGIPKPPKEGETDPVKIAEVGRNVVNWILTGSVSLDDEKKTSSEEEKTTCENKSDCPCGGGAQCMENTFESNLTYMFNYIKNQNNSSSSAEEVNEVTPFPETTSTTSSANEHASTQDSIPETKL